LFDWILQVRRVWEHYGFTVTRLIRRAFGPFELGKLQASETEEVEASEVQALRERLEAFGPDAQGTRSAQSSEREDENEDEEDEEEDLR